MNRGAIILCGGKSSRMGTDKALLPFGDETMLVRTLRIVGLTVEPLHTIVVAASNQQLPPLPKSITLVRDQAEYQGPLAGIARGLAALSPRVEAVFVTGCDAPLLTPQLINYLFAQLGSHDAVVPQDADRLHPLCAVYHTRLVRAIEEQLKTADQSLHTWIAGINANLVSLESLREVDPQLQSFLNVNRHDDYVAALAAAGLSTP